MFKFSSVFLAAFVGLPAMAQSEKEIKLSGYADLRLTHLQYDDRSNLVGSPESGFGLEDGALYLNYRHQNIEFMMDIPFRRFKDADRTGVTSDSASNSPNFLFGADKAQAYGRMQTGLGFDIMMGQFDTIYGVELNDSKDRFFSKTGLVYDKLLPVTHMGAMVTTKLSEFSLKAFIANPAGKGTIGSSTTGDENYEYGAALGFANEHFRSQMGYLSRGIRKTSGEPDGNRSLIDITLGYTLGPANFDVEYAILSDDSKNSLTPPVDDREESGTGFLALLTYSLTDSISLGARYEIVENDPALEAKLKSTSTSIGMSYKWSDILLSKLDAVHYVSTPITGEDSLVDYRFAFSNIFLF